MGLVKLIWDVGRLAGKAKDAADLMDTEKATERLLYNRVYKDEIISIIEKAGNRELDKPAFMEAYRETITKHEIHSRPLYVSHLTGFLAQVEYALEERHIGNFGQLQMHALRWALKKHMKEYEKVFEKGEDVYTEFSHEKYGDMLYEQYEKRYKKS
jgi:hypothetical protein